MTKLENCKVVQSNKLIQRTVWNMDLIMLKTFKVLVSAIDTKTATLADNMVRVNKRELMSLVTQDKHLRNTTQFIDVLERLTDVKLHIPVSPDTDKEAFISTHLLKYKHYRYEEYVDVTFDSDVMPHLVQLKKKFLSYPVEHISRLKTKYGLVLYEYLLSMYKQFYSDQSHAKIIIKVDELRHVTGTLNKSSYDVWGEFNRRVLDPAVKDINDAKVSIEILEVEKHRTGRKITDLVFLVCCRNFKIPEIPNNPYQDELF